VAKLGTMYELCDFCGTKILLYSPETGDVPSPPCPKCGRSMADRQAAFLAKWSAARKERETKALLADMLKEDVNYYAKLAAKPVPEEPAKPPSVATGGMMTLRAGTGDGSDVFKSTAGRIRFNAEAGRVEFSRAGGEWVPFEAPAPAREQTAAPQEEAEPEVRPRRRFRFGNEKKE